MRLFVSLSQKDIVSDFIQLAAKEAVSVILETQLNYYPCS